MSSRRTSSNSSLKRSEQENGIQANSGTPNFAAAKDDQIRDRSEANYTVPDSHKARTITWPFGVGPILVFLVSFIIFDVLRGVLRGPSLLYRLFAKMYLAGTIIFGGGPVVIPLLRKYIVAEN